MTRHTQGAALRFSSGSRYRKLPHLLLFFSVVAITAFTSFEPAQAEEMEHYDTPFQNISPAILKDAVGVLSILKAERPQTTFELSSGKFLPKGTIDFKTQTTPVSHFGYKGQKHLPARYPVLRVDEGYLLVSIDQTNDTRVWIKSKTTLAQLQGKLVMFNSLAKDVRRNDGYIGYDVDPFFTTDKVKVFSSPSNEASFQVHHSSSALDTTPLGQQGNFIRIGSPARKKPNDTGQEVDAPEKTFGWIQIRDSEGSLLIWIGASITC